MSMQVAATVPVGLWITLVALAAGVGFSSGLAFAIAFLK